MNITREQLEQLTRIYNTLLEVPTKGEGSFIMTDALRAFEQVIIAIGKNPPLQVAIEQGEDITEEG